MGAAKKLTNPFLFPSVKFALFLIGAFLRFNIAQISVFKNWSKVIKIFVKGSYRERVYQMRMDLITVTVS